MRPYRNAASAIATAAWFALAALLFSAPVALAQSDAGSLPQIELTESHVTNFIAMQKTIISMASELESAGDEQDAKLRAKLEKIATSHGFQSFDEFDAVAASITLVIAGLDPDTRDYTDPKIGIAADIKDIKTDKTLTEKERAELLRDLEEALATTPDIKFPGNIDLVKKHAAEIEKVLE